MNLVSLSWLSGLSLVIGGSLATIGWIGFAFIDPNHQHQQQRYWNHLNLSIIAGGLLMSLGLPGFYIQQAQVAGWWGLIGFISLYTGLVLSHLAVHSIETATMPDFPPMMMWLVRIAAPSLFMGILMTGIVTWQAGIFPHLFGAFLTFSAVAGLLTIIPKIPAWLGRNVASCLFPIAMIWVGILLMR